MFPDLGRTVPLVPPLVPAAVYSFPDLDALDAVYAGEAPGFVYARDGHPNAVHFARELAERHSANWGLATGSGMGAIAAAVLAHVSAGERIVTATRLYGRTRQLFATELSRFGVQVTFADASDPAAMQTAIAGAPVKLVFVETLSNPLCRVADVPVLAELAHEAGAVLVVDNTFATPVVCRPLELGADVVMESVTKLIGGHSDVTLGFLGGRDPAMLAKAKFASSAWGLSGSPFDCWLAARGLETLELRAAAACANAARLADWLAEQPGVERVYYPGRPDHPDHEAAVRLFPNGFGHMLAFSLAGSRDAVNRLMRSAPGIPFSPSLGHTTTTLSHPDSTSHRYDDPAAKAREGITPGLVRLSVGCEPFEKAVAELAKGLTSSPERPAV